jgi:hypothetical protein
MNTPLPSPLKATKGHAMPTKTVKRNLEWGNGKEKPNSRPGIAQKFRYA